MPRTLNLNDLLFRGIRPSYRLGRNHPFALDVRNAVATPEGLYPYEPVTDLGHADKAYPYPQIFKGPNHTVVLFENLVYHVPDETTTWSAGSNLALSSPYDSSTPTIPSGGLWHIAFHYNGWIACNGKCMLFYIGEMGSGTCYVEETVYPLSVCELFGRVFFGGMGRYWQNVIDQYGGDYDLNFLASTVTENMSDSWVGWKSIQGDDIFDFVWPHLLLDKYASDHGTELADEPIPDSTGDWSEDTGGVEWVITDGVKAAATAAGAFDTLSYALDGTEVEYDTWYLVEVTVSSYTSGTVRLGFWDAADGGNVDVELSGVGVLRAVIKTKEASLGFPTITVNGTGSAFTGEINNLSIKETFNPEEFGQLDMWMQRQDSGFSPAHQNGVVLKVMQLSDNVIVYGDTFITAYYPVQSPIPTFGKRELANFGIIGRGGAGGDRDGHLFIDNKGSLWSLATDLTMVELGYQELFESSITDRSSTWDPTEDSVLTINWDPNRRWAYITSDVDGAGDYRTFIYTGSGMSRLDTEYIISLVGLRQHSTDHWLTGEVFNISPEIFQLDTDVFDMGSSDLKTIETVKLSGTFTTDMTVRLEYKVDQGGSFLATPYNTVSDDGKIDFFLTGVEFRLSIKGDAYGAVKLDNIEVYWSHPTDMSKLSYRELSRRR